MQNGFCESFNDCMRHELLNESLFFGLDHARRVIGTLTDDCNTARPHSSLSYQTPGACAASLTATGARLRNPDQLRRPPVALTAPKGVSTAKARTVAGCCCLIFGGVIASGLLTQIYAALGARIKAVRK